MTASSCAQWLARGRSHQAEQRPVDAMLCFRRAVRADPARPDARAHLAQVLWQLGRLNEAVAEWRESARLDPANVATLVALAEASLAVGDVGQAQAAATQALARSPGLAPALLISGTAGLTHDAGGGGDHDHAAREILEALALDHGLIKVPSLAGPLAAALDRLRDPPVRTHLLGEIAKLAEHGPILAAVPALLLAQVVEQAGATGSGPATATHALLHKAAERAYGWSEHDALRRLARAASSGGDPAASALTQRYVELCREAFTSSLPLLWPRRTSGAALRVLVLLDARSPGAAALRSALASSTRARCEFTFACIGGDVTVPPEASPGHDGTGRTIGLPALPGLADAKALAALDADVLVDPVGLDAPVGPLLVARPARHVIGLTECATIVTALVDEEIGSLAKLEQVLIERAEALVGAEAGMPSAPAMAALFNDAVRLHQEGQHATAAERYEQALHYQPAHAQVLYLRGVLRRETGDLEGGLADFTATLAAAPRFIDARVAAAQAALDLGRAELAANIARQELADAPGFTALWRVLGLVHLARGEAHIAAEVFEHALQLDMADGETHYNHGVALQTQRRFADAARAYQRALAFRPDLIAADFNLGVMFQEQGNNAAAVAAYSQVLHEDPGHVSAYKNLGEVLFAAGRLDEWRANFARFEAHCPQALPLAVQALEVCQHFAEFERLEHYLDGLRYERFAARSPAELAEALEELLYLLLFFDVEPDLVHRFSRTYDHTARVVYGQPLSLSGERHPGRIRLGYLSADLRNHVMGKMMWEAVQHHDRERFELCFYSLSSAADEWTERFRKLGDRFVVVANASDAQAAQRIAADDLDILVDLSTHTRGARPGILARKPARLQITHVASAGAVGLSTIDFKLTDHWADVPANQEHMIERLLAMEGCVYPYRHIAPAAHARYDRARLGIAEDAIVIGAFVTPMKLSRRCLRLWSEVLQSVPRARLALSPNHPAWQSSFLRLAKAVGIGPERLVMVPQGRDEHVNQARYTLVDLVLDPMPFGGVNGTLEALDMHVPVVTLCGGRHGERTSYSILANLGVTDTVAASGPEYVELAVRLANDRAFMDAVRDKIRHGLARSALTDMKAHTRNLETAYCAAMERKRADTAAGAQP